MAEKEAEPVALIEGLKNIMTGFPGRSEERLTRETMIIRLKRVVQNSRRMPKGYFHTKKGLKKGMERPGRELYA